MGIYVFLSIAYRIADSRIKRKIRIADWGEQILWEQQEHLAVIHEYAQRVLFFCYPVQ